jgi:hypothetical protein
VVGVKHVQEQIIASGCTGDDNTKANHILCGQNRFYRFRWILDSL